MTPSVGCHTQCLFCNFGLQQQATHLSQHSYSAVAEHLAQEHRLDYTYPLFVQRTAHSAYHPHKLYWRRQSSISRDTSLLKGHMERMEQFSIPSHGHRVELDIFRVRHPPVDTGSISPYRNIYFWAHQISFRGFLAVSIMGSIGK